MTILFDRVGVRLGERNVLSDISCELSQHRIGIIGNNGSGKSTFARLLNALILPTKGRVTVDGLDTATAATQVRGRVGFVFQNPDAQIVMPTVGEDVAFGPRMAGLSRDESQAKGDESLAAFGLLSKKHQAALTLSGGEKQALALAGVLATDPEWIVFDEPTTMLDRKRAKAAMERVVSLEQRVIVVTHHVELLTGFDRVLVLNDGALVHDDIPSRAIAFYLETLT